MDKKEWFLLFDETKETFHWFFTKYFGTYTWDALMDYRKTENMFNMISLMNKVWFELPDSKFNIIENPPGWSEFLNLIEQ